MMPIGQWSSMLLLSEQAPTCETKTEAVYTRLNLVILQVLNHCVGKRRGVYYAYIQ